jgi:hypothetical protein
MDGVLSREKAVETYIIHSPSCGADALECFGLTSSLSFTWLYEKNFVFVGCPRVKSTNVGIALGEGVFDRMEMVLTEVLCVRGIQTMSLK